MDTLGVFLLQRSSSLDPAENRAALAVVSEACSGRPAKHLIVFPEVFARDFGSPGSDIAEHAEALDGPFVTRLAQLSAAHDVTLVAGMFEASEDRTRPFNTLVVVGPAGLQAAYRKIHLYDSFGYRESDRLSAGPPEPVVVEVQGWQVGLMTCYDLRFPELARALVERGAELLLVPAAWVAGDRKVDHWRTLLRARAIENTVYVAGVGQPGPRYCGHSMIVAPDGDVLAELGRDHDGEGTYAGLTRPHLEEVRRTNPSLVNRRL